MKTTTAEFEAMMKAHVVSEAGDFLEEERHAVAVHVANASKSLVAFGDQNLVHWPTAKRRQIAYLLVDPQDPVALPTDSGFTHSKTLFEDLTTAELPADMPRGFVFSFNLYSYLNAPSSALASILTRDDLVCISNWTIGAPARAAYLQALRAATGRTPPLLDTDPLKDLHLLQISLSRLGRKTSVWREVNRESTQFFLRCH